MISSIFHNYISKTAPWQEWSLSQEPQDARLGTPAHPSVHTQTLNIVMPQLIDPYLHNLTFLSGCEEIRVPGGNKEERNQQRTEGLTESTSLEAHAHPVPQ